MGDFFDVFPSTGMLWGMVVGDVCGKGPMAAKSAALARNTLRAAARRVTRPARLSRRAPFQARSGSPEIAQVTS